MESIVEFESTLHCAAAAGRSQDGVLKQPLRVRASEVALEAIILASHRSSDAYYDDISVVAIGDFGPEFIRGDANNDMAYDTADALFILNALY